MSYDNILLINSYAGSLMIAAKKEKMNVLASLEDKGYGIGSQKLNYPKENYIDAAPWPHPGRDLSNVVTLAHPPCACFSVQGAQSKNPKTRGLGSDHFKSSRLAIEFALQHRTAALAVESVMGTLEGARVYHDRVAKKYGYRLYRVLQNAITFGVPQWRQRFWLIMIREDLARPKLWLQHSYKLRSIGESLQGVKPGEENWYVRREFDKITKRVRDHGVTKLQLEKILDGDFGYGNLPMLVARARGLEHKHGKVYDVCRKFGITTFSSSWPLILHPDGFTPAVMCTSHFWYQGRPLTMPEYNVVAGFPASYQFHTPKFQQCLLSRGVAPPVARWVLQQVRHNLNGWQPKGTVGADHTAALESGEVADFRIKRGEIRQRRLFYTGEDEAA